MDKMQRAPGQQGTWLATTCCSERRAARRRSPTLGPGGQHHGQRVDACAAAPVLADGCTTWSFRDDCLQTTPWAVVQWSYRAGDLFVSNVRLGKSITMIRIPTPSSCPCKHRHKTTKPSKQSPG